MSRDKGSTYMKVLEAQKRRLGDYEQVHFRKSWSRTVYEGISSTELTSINSRPFLQPQVLEFSRATAKPYLQQTESIWLKLDLSRQNATEQLLDKKLGSFYVRSSSKSKYALSVRLSDEDDCPVMHYLIYCNSAGFYGIQGSNLQFVTLYDLLAYFCYQQSGGMPCLLSPPMMQNKKGFYLSDSESDTDDDEENPFSPDVCEPPKKYFEETSFQNLSSDSSIPPPLPPRKRPSDQQHNYLDNHYDFHDVIKRVAPLVDDNNKNLIKTLTNTTSTENHANSETTPTNDVIARGYKNLVILQEPSDNELSSATPHDSPELLPPPLPPRIEKVEIPKDPPAIPPKVAPPPIPPRTRHLTENYPNEFEPTKQYCRNHRRAASDSSIISGGATEDIVDTHPLSPLPPPVPPKKKALLAEMVTRGDQILSNAEQKDEKEKEKENENEKKEKMMEEEGWTIVDPLEESTVSQLTSSTASTPGKQHHKWKKPRWARKLKKWRRKPRSRVKHFILDLSEDKNSEFGARVYFFLQTVLTKGNEPHQKLLSDVREFLSHMRELLLNQYRVELLSNGMDSCSNFEHLLEATLQQCITQPLYKFLYESLEENLTSSGSMDQLKEAVVNARNKTTEDLGIRSHLLVPNDKSLQDINNIFTKLKQTYCAMRKLEYLLEAVRLTYEGVKDVNNPKKTMNDLGADDFLPLFVWVLAHTNFITAEIEAEYIWGLAHPSLFNGEGGYYLTTLTSAINVLRELCSNECNQENQQNIRKTSTLKTELEIQFENPDTPGKFDGPHLFPVLPTMSVSEICDIISERLQISNPEEYALCTLVNGKVTPLDGGECPQEITICWQLQSNDSTERLLVYMKSTNINR